MKLTPHQIEVILDVIEDMATAAVADQNREWDCNSEMYYARMRATEKLEKLDEPPSS